MRIIIYHINIGVGVVLACLYVYYLLFDKRITKKLFFSVCFLDGFIFESAFVYLSSDFLKCLLLAIMIFIFIVLIISLLRDNIFDLVEKILFGLFTILLIGIIGFIFIKFDAISMIFIVFWTIYMVYNIYNFRCDIVEDPIIIELVKSNSKEVDIYVLRHVYYMYINIIALAKSIYRHSKK